MKYKLWKCSIITCMRWIAHKIMPSTWLNCWVNILCYCSFNLLLKVLNVEMYTVIKDIKSELVTLLMLQSAEHGSFSLSHFFAGRLLASFRSSFTHLVPDGKSEVYVKKAKAPETSTVWDEEQTEQLCFSWIGVTGVWDERLRTPGDVKQSKMLRLRWETVSSSQTCWTQLGSVGLRKAEEEAFEVRRVNVMYL